MRKPITIGTYRDIKGKTHTKYKDDENYQFINIRGKRNIYPITISGDGITTTQEDIYKEIELAKNDWD